MNKASKPTYQTPDPGWMGDPRRGAGLGRHETRIPRDFEGTLTVRGVPLDEGGYDPGGAYWGHPSNLFVVRDEDGREEYLRGTMAFVRARFPKAKWAATDTISKSDIDDMVAGYIRCALWISSDEKEVPLDDAKYGEDKLTKASKKELRKQCQDFAKKNTALLLRTVNEGHMPWEDIGHNLWLSRNGHGTGFWDRGLPEELGEALHEAARNAGTRYLLVYRSWIHAG